MDNISRAATTPFGKNSRREFLERLLRVIRALGFGGAGVALSRCGNYSTDKPSSGGSPSVTSCDAAGSVNTSITANAQSQILLCLNTYTSLKQVDGSYRLSVTLPSGSARTISVTRTAASAIAAVSAICPHQSCVVDAYDASARTFTCPCHASEFRADGSLVAGSGPAVSDLSTFPATLSDASVTVTLS